MKRKIPRHKKTLLIAGLIIILFMLFLAVAAPWLAHHDPNTMSLADRYALPSADHPLGRDENGSDIFAKILYGARISMGVAFLVVLVSGSIGLILGSVAGFCGRWMDVIIMRFIDMLYAFPSFLLALALVAMLGPSIRNLIIALCLTSWTGYARLVRGEVLHLREREYVLTAKAMGASSVRQVVLHIWPNLVGVLLVHSTFAMAGTIISESGLSFLGLGAPATTPTWGALLNAGRRALSEAPHISAFPGLAILLLVLGFNLLGDGLRDFLDPKKSVQ